MSDSIIGSYTQCMLLIEAATSLDPVHFAALKAVRDCVHQESVASHEQRRKTQRSEEIDPLA